MPTLTHITTKPNPSSGPRNRSVNATSKAAVSLSSDFGSLGQELPNRRGNWARHSDAPGGRRTIDWPRTMPALFCRVAAAFSVLLI